MDGWDRFYQTVVDETQKGVWERLDRFRISLGDWFWPTINWPPPDWRDQLYRFVEHTRYYGLIIEQDAIDRFRYLIEARVNGTGPFVELGPYRFDQPPAATDAQVQLAMGVAMDDGTRTDAAVAGDSGAKPTMRDGHEVAGPGPETTKSFQEKVLAALAIIDVEIATWWQRAGGRIRSRSASAWSNFMRANERTFIENNTPIVLVDQNYTVAQTAAAIVAGTQKIGPFRDRFDQERIAGSDAADRYAEIQQERLREAAAIAGGIAETFYTVIGSLTIAGEVVVAVDDVSRNGLSWDQLLLLLPALPLLRKGIKTLVVKLPGGRQLRVSGRQLEALREMNAAERRALLAKARKAKTEEEALAIIDDGVGRGRRQGHHLATEKNWKSALRGGPWSPKFEAIFKRAGMSLSDAENIVHIPGHFGPHSEAYHREIYRRLTTATRRKRGKAYKEALIKELRSLAQDAKTRGTKLHRLLTSPG